MEKIKKSFLDAYTRVVNKYHLDFIDVDNNLKDINQIVIYMWTDFTLLEQETYLLKYAKINAEFISRLDIIEEEFKMLLDKFLKNNKNKLKELILQDGVK